MTINKRTILRNKFVRLYEEDIWGIFWKKQKKRSFFFKNIGYQFFLEILCTKVRERKDFIKGNKVFKYSFRNDLKWFFKKDKTFLSLFLKFFFSNLNKFNYVHNISDKVIFKFNKFLIHRYLFKFKQLIYLRKQLKKKYHKVYFNKYLYSNLRTKSSRFFNLFFLSKFFFVYLRKIRVDKNFLLNKRLFNKKRLLNNNNNKHLLFNINIKKKKTKFFNTHKFRLLSKIKTIRLFKYTNLYQNKFFNFFFYDINSSFLINRLIFANLYLNYLVFFKKKKKKFDINNKFHLNNNKFKFFGTNNYFLFSYFFKFKNFNKIKWFKFFFIKKFRINLFYYVKFFNKKKLRLLKFFNMFKYSFRFYFAKLINKNSLKKKNIFFFLKNFYNFDYINYNCLPSALIRNDLKNFNFVISKNNCVKFSSSLKYKKDFKFNNIFNDFYYLFFNLDKNNNIYFVKNSKLKTRLPLLRNTYFNFYNLTNKFIKTDLINNFNIFTNIESYYFYTNAKINNIINLKLKKTHTFFLNSFFGSELCNTVNLKRNFILLNNKYSRKFYENNNNIKNFSFISFFNTNILSFTHMLKVFYSSYRVSKKNTFYINNKPIYPFFYIRFLNYSYNFSSLISFRLKSFFNKFIFNYFFKYNYKITNTINIINSLNILFKLRNTNFIFNDFCYYLLCLSYVLPLFLNKKLYSNISSFMDSSDFLFSTNFFSAQARNTFHNNYYNSFNWFFFKSLFTYDFNALNLNSLSFLFSKFLINLNSNLENNSLKILYRRLYNFNLSTIFVNKFGIIFLKKFLLLRFKEWSTFELKFVFFINKNIVNATAWARKQVKRTLYALQNFIYFRFNKSNDDSDYNINLDFEKLSIKSNKYNGFLISYINWLKKKNTSFSYNKRKDITKIITSTSIVFNRTEYLLSFYASNRVYKFFNKIRGRFISNFHLCKNLNNFSNYKHNSFYYNYNISKFSWKLSKNSNLLKYYNSLRIKLDSVKKHLVFYSIKKRKTEFQKLFTLNIISVVKFVKKRTKFCSFYKYRMLKIWKFRKFYGCLTDYELFSICKKAYKMHGDILHQFIMLLECRLDTLLFRSGLVSSMFEARQFINHGNVLVNDKIITRRSFVLQLNDFVSIKPEIFLKLKKKIITRLTTEGIIANPPVYLEINYNFFIIFFLHDVLKASQVPFNFNMTGYDINNILYYYY